MGQWGRACMAALAVALAGAAAAEQGDPTLRRPGSGGGTEAEPGPFFAAEVAADGTLVSGTGAIAARRVTEEEGCADGGCYEVLFRRNNLHRACWWSATIGRRAAGGSEAGDIFAEARAATNNGLFVVTRDAAGVRADRPFILTVLCR